MTVPLLADKLGDFTQVQLGPNQPVPIMNGVPGVTVTMANQDLTNTVTIARRNNFQQNASNTATIPPLGSVTVDASKTIWGLAPQGTLPLLIFPGGGNWAPSPAQVAAQINALGLMKDTTGVAINTNVTGVAKDASILPLAKDTSITPLAKDASITPLAKDASITPLAKDTSVTALPGTIATTGVPALNLKSTTTVGTGLVIAAGVTTAMTAVTGINQPAYNLHLTATAGGASTKPWYTVNVKWIDTTTGFVVQFDSYTAWMSATSNVMSTVIAGPTDADQCQISVTNNDTVSMTLNTAFFVLSSRSNYTTDVVYQFWTTAAMPTVPTFQIGAALQVPTERVLFSVSRSVGIGVTTTPDYVIPVYSGQAFLHFDGGSSNNWDVLMTDQFTSTTLLRINPSAAGAFFNVPFVMPRTPCTIHITNNGTVSGTANLEITAV